MNFDFLRHLILPALIAYIPCGRWLTRRFTRRMQAADWTPRKAALYALLLAFLYTPGCVQMDLMHGNWLPAPVPAWLALACGSIWGGAIPLCVGWVYAYHRVQTRIIPKWLLEERDRSQ